MFNGCYKCNKLLKYINKFLLTTIRYVILMCFIFNTCLTYLGLIKLFVLNFSIKSFIFKLV